MRPSAVTNGNAERLVRSDLILAGVAVSQDEIGANSGNQAEDHFDHRRGAAELAVESSLPIPIDLSKRLDPPSRKSRRAAAFIVVFRFLLRPWRRIGRRRAFEHEVPWRYPRNPCP